MANSFSDNKEPGRTFSQRTLSLFKSQLKLTPVPLTSPSLPAGTSATSCMGSLRPRVTYKASKSILYKARKRSL